MKTPNQAPNPEEARMSTKELIATLKHDSNYKGSSYLITVASRLAAQEEEIKEFRKELHTKVVKHMFGDRFSGFGCIPRDVLIDMIKKKEKTIRKLGPELQSALKRIKELESEK